MSSGLVATMGLPAQALGRASAPEAVAPATAPIAVQPALAFQSGLIAAPASAQTSAVPLTAPAAATVTFEDSGFKAVPTVVAPPSVAGGGSASPGSVKGYTGGFGSLKGASIIAIASRYIGVPYVYGGTTPGGWDCSGATKYIYGLAGKSIPRTAQQQMVASRRISRSQAVPGDLLWFVSGGHAYHVAIYAGNNMMYDAQRTGKAFTKRAIYSSNVVFGSF